MYTYRGKLIYVVDGDTVSILLDLGFKIFTEQRFRLHGIDSPELNSIKEAERIVAINAKEYLKKYLNRDVEVYSMGKDKYGRWIGDIFIDKKNLSKELLELNFAKKYERR